MSAVSLPLLPQTVPHTTGVPFWLWTLCSLAPFNAWEESLVNKLTTSSTPTPLGRRLVNVSWAKLDSLQMKD